MGDINFVKRATARDGTGGGGSNILRGGKSKKTFSSSTKVGNWVEEEYNPFNASLATGFINSKYLTTYQAATNESGKVKLPEFGVGLDKDEGPFNYKNIVTPDNRFVENSWRTLNQDYGSKNVSEFSTTFHLTGGMTKQEELEGYRSRWTSETEGLKELRFTTEAARTQALTKQ